MFSKAVLQILAGNNFEEKLSSEGIYGNSIKIAGLPVIVTSNLDGIIPVDFYLCSGA